MHCYCTAESETGQVLYILSTFLTAQVLTLSTFAFTFTSVVTDSRKSQRFNLKLPMTLLRCGGKAVERPYETSNISSTGVLFRTDGEMAIGDPVEYVLTLAPPMGPRKSVQLHCLGKVVRAVESEAVAATIERYEFVRV